MDDRLEAALGVLADQYDVQSMHRDAKAISESYRMRTGKGHRLLTQEGEAAAYALSRMPATYAAASAALSWALEAAGLAPQTLLDCGAGTGAVTWAADDLLDLREILCLEREAAMQKIGRGLMREADGALAQAEWKAFDLTANEPLPRAQLVCEGYMLGELKEEMRLPVAERIYEAAEQMLLLIEPGTPQGFANLAAVRTHLAGLGAYIAAPCPQGMKQCPMQDGDWCHFAVRVQRTKLHKALKGGQAPYEDEKFAYLALTKLPPASPCVSRVLRHPQIDPGRIVLTLCEEGGAEKRTITKKDPLWKRARKIGAGEQLE